MLDKNYADKYRCLRKKNLRIFFPPSPLKSRRKLTNTTTFLNRAIPFHIAIGSRAHTHIHTELKTITQGFFFVFFFLTFRLYFLLPSELLEESKQQNKLQPCLWDPSISGLHLRKYHGWPGPAGSLHQWEECSAGQPDSGKFDWVLPGPMPWKSGNQESRSPRKTISD